MTPLKVLVVDDSARMRQAVMEVLLTVPGCAIVGEGSNGLEGLQLTRDIRPDLVVMDINMPEMGGMKALRLLKSELPCTRVVMMTATVDPEVRKVVLEDGATACLEKGPELWDGLVAIAMQLSQAPLCVAT